MKYHIRFIHFIAILTAILVPVFVQAVEPDSYEEDDTAAQAKIIILNDAESQKRSFHETGDEDWIKFYGLAEEKYSVQAENVGADCDVVIRLYDTDGVTFLEKGDDGGKGMADSLKSSPLSRDGIYYVKIHNISEIFGENTQYDLRIFLTDASAPVAARFKGTTADALSKSPLGNVMIKTDQNFTALSDQGSYTMYHPISQSTTAYTLTARLSGYQVFTKSVFTTDTGFKTTANSSGKRETANSSGKREETEIVEWDGLIEMVPKGDINGDGKIDLADAVAGLQAQTGTAAPGTVRPDYIASEADVNGDDKVGLEEVIRILNRLIQ
jgi:hypothetical protein